MILRHVEPGLGVFTASLAPAEDASRHRLEFVWQGGGQGEHGFFSFPIWQHASIATLTDVARQLLPHVMRGARLAKYLRDGGMPPEDR